MPIHKRGTERHLAKAVEVFDEVEKSPVMPARSTETLSNRKALNRETQG